MSYLAEQQQVDVNKRLEGLRKISDGAQGFELRPILLIGVLLFALALVAFRAQKRRRREELEEDRRIRREEEERRQRRLAEEAAKQQKFQLTEAREHECVAPCPVTDLVRIRAGVKGALVPREPGYPPHGIMILEPVDGGLLVVPPSDAIATPPEGELWLSVRQSGAPRFYPVEVRRRVGEGPTDALLATPTGPGWKFARFGRQPASFPAIAIPIDGQSPPRDEDAVPVKITSIGIGSLEFTGPVEVGGGTKLCLRVALPDELDSLEIPGRVRNQSRDDAGTDQIEVAFDAIPGFGLDLLARGIVQHLEAPSLEPSPLVM